MISLILTMTRGRPQEFDREKALGKAMDLFWSQGYQAAGMEALTKHMGISRQSLYNTFGDKHSLLKEAIDYYSKQLCTNWGKMFNASPSPLKNLEGFLKFVETYLYSKDFRGCLFANTALEMGHKDPVIQKLLNKRSVESEQHIEDVLNRAVKCEELINTVNTQALARFIINIIRGLMVTTKGGGTKAEIKDVLNSLRTHLKQFESK